MGFVTNLRERFADALEDKRDDVRAFATKNGVYVGSAVGVVATYAVGASLLMMAIGTAAAAVGATFYADKAVDKVIDGTQHVLRP